METLFNTSVYKEVGERHLYKNKLCEDAVSKEHSSNGDIAAVVLCDGAGSCIHAREGSEVASNVASELLINEFNKLWEYGETEFAQHIIKQVCDAMGKMAADNGWTLESMSTTLLCAAMHHDGRYMIFHVGDGVIVGFNNNFESEIVSQYVHEIADNIATFVNIPGTNYKVMRGTGKYNSFLLTSDGAEPYLFPNGKVSVQVFVLQQSAFVMSENRMVELMASLTDTLKKRCKAYDDISFAAIVDIEKIGDIIFKIDKALLSKLLNLQKYPERSKDKKAFLTVMKELQKHPEGVTFDKISRLLYTHRRDRAVKRVRKFFSEETVVTSKGKFYLK